MLFSGKITNSVFTFLQSQGIELGEVYDWTDLPPEFLRDPSCWLEASKVEDLLAQLENFSLMKHNTDGVLQQAGHQAKELKAWGVLDSVLRMIENPYDIFMQPQRFISYFVSPAPPIANIHRDAHSVAFDLPIAFEEYPRVATYLCSALEGVPLFIGKQMAEASWKQNRMLVRWEQSQPLLGDEDIERRQMAPEVMQNLITTLERTEQALVEKTRELEKIKVENTLAAQSQPASLDDFHQFREKFENFRQQVLRLQDYFTRSQQLITLLIGQDRMSAQVREAMKRVNWEQVQSAFPEVAQDLITGFELRTQQKPEKEHAENHQSPRPRDLRQPWLSHN